MPRNPKLASYVTDYQQLTKTMKFIQFANSPCIRTPYYTGFLYNPDAIALQYSRATTAARICERRVRQVSSSNIMKKQLWRRLNAPFTAEVVTYSTRTAIAAILSFLVARAFTLPEAYWAPISTLIVVQSARGSALSVAGHRFLGTVLGAMVGALLGTWFGSSIWLFGFGVLLLGFICAAFGSPDRKLHEKLDRATYRYAGITLAIILLIPRPQAPWNIALHRFLEVSIGIVMGLVMTIVWPDASAKSGKTS